MRRRKAPNRHPDERARRRSIREALPITNIPPDNPNPPGQRHQHLRKQVIRKPAPRDRRREGYRGLVRTPNRHRPPLLGRRDRHYQPQAMEVRTVRLREHRQHQLVPPRQWRRERGVLVQAFEVRSASAQGVVQEPVLERSPAVHEAGRGDLCRR